MVMAGRPILPLVASEEKGVAEEKAVRLVPPFLEFPDSTTFTFTPTPSPLLLLHYFRAARCIPAFAFRLHSALFIMHATDPLAIHAHDLCYTRHPLPPSIRGQ